MAALTSILTDFDKTRKEYLVKKRYDIFRNNAAKNRVLHNFKRHESKQALTGLDSWTILTKIYNVNIAGGKNHYPKYFVKPIFKWKKCFTEFLTKNHNQKYFVKPVFKWNNWFHGNFAT